MGYMTRVGGIAYQALNIYFFSWAGLICSCYTFYNYLELRGYFVLYARNNQNQHILKTQTQTNTLSGWMALFIGSLVEFIAALDAKEETEYDGYSSSEASWAISVGAVSMIVSLLITFSHFINMGPLTSIIHGTCCQFVVALFLVVWWTIGVAVLTQNGKIGSVLGVNCKATATAVDDSRYQNKNSNNIAVEMDWTDGSNLYFSLWFSFFSACWVVIKWRGGDEHNAGVYDEKQRAHMLELEQAQFTTHSHSSQSHPHHHSHSSPPKNATHSEVTSIRLGDEHF